VERKKVEVVKKLTGLLRPFRGKIVTILLCLICTAFLNLLIPLCTESLMDRGFLNNNFHVVVNVSLILLTIQFINILLGTIKEKIRISIEKDIISNLSEQAYQHLLKLKINYFDNKNSAEILQNTLTDTMKIGSIASPQLFLAVTQILNFIGGIIGLLLISWKLSFLVLLFIPLKYIAVCFFAKQRLKATENYIDSYGDYAKWYGNVLAGMREIRTLDLSKKKYAEFKRKCNEFLENRRKMMWLDTIDGNINTLLVQILIAAIYIYGANEVFNFQISVGGFFAFISFSGYVTDPIALFMGIFYSFSDIIPSSKRYFEFLDLEEEDNRGGWLNEDIEKIEFENVNFCYKSNEEILENVSFVINKGDRIAIIGENGVGKTTILLLLLRFYEPNCGRILINGKDIRNYMITSYRKKISVVSQRVYLFNDTLRNNICLGENLEKAQLYDILRKSNLTEFCDENKLDNLVGENGIMLSGGQVQKIALARTLAQNREILIFDEVTSNMDKISQENVSELIRSKKKQNIIIWVTHDPEFLKLADKIIVVENKRLVVKNNKERR